MITRSSQSLNFVTPAQAGVHHRRWKFQQRVMDSRLRGNDEKVRWLLEGASQ
jgi:hypothetical protein